MMVEDDFSACCEADAVRVWDFIAPGRIELWRQCDKCGTTLVTLGTALLEASSSS